MNEHYQQLIQQFPGIEQNKPLAPLVTFGIGGPADLFYKLTDTAAFEPLITAAGKLGIPVFVLGGGSNTIFADEGYRGLVIHIQAKNIALEALPDSREESLVAADAGLLLSQVIQFALKNKLTGMEKMMGLPGTLGGAVRGNAGAFGIELKDVFEKALVYSKEESLLEAGKKDMDFSYRSSRIKKTRETVLKVWLRLKMADPVTAKTALDEAMDIVKNRISKQPKGKCSGSFFKNPVTPDYKNPQPPETKAGHLLEQIGAKGMQVGGVMVSKEHANWLMNTGNGTQKDVLELSKRLQEKVKERFGVLLEREVQLVSPQGLFI